MEVCTYMCAYITHNHKMKIWKTQSLGKGVCHPTARLTLQKFCLGSFQLLVNHFF